MLRQMAYLLILTAICAYSAPLLQFKQSIPCYYNASSPNETCKMIKITSKYISRLTSNSVIQFFNKSTYDQVKALNYYNVSNISMYDVANDMDLMIISINSNLQFIHINNNTQAFLPLNLTTKSLATVDSRIIITVSEGNQQKLLVYRMNSNNLSSLEGPILEHTFSYGINIKRVYSPDRNILISWNSSSTFNVYALENNQTSITHIGTILSNTGIEWLTQEVTFSQDSKCFLLQVGKYLPIRIVCVSPNYSLSIRNISYDGTIEKVMFLDQSSQYIMVFSGLSTLYFDVQTLSQVSIQNTPFLTSVSQINYAAKIIYFCTNNTLEVYSIRSQPQKITNKTSNINQYQEMLMNNTKKGIYYTNGVLQKVVIGFSIFPYAYFFLSSLNFFSICSLYVFLNVEIPMNLYQILKMSQNAMNANVFNLLGLNLDFSFVKQQKVNNSKYIDLGLSSNFLESNYQSFLSAILILFILFLMRRLMKYANKGELAYRLLNHEYIDVIFGIVLSNIVPILLPYLFIFNNISFQSFSSKGNLSMSISFIGFLIISIALVISFKGVKLIVKRKKKVYMVSKKGQLSRHVKTTKEVKDNQANLLKDQRQTLYFGANNLIFVLLITLNDPIYFLIIGQLFTFCGIYKALSYRKWRINRVILSIYPIIFHFCFILFHWVDNTDLMIYATITCLLTYLVGSIHQFLNIIFQFLNFVWRYRRRNNGNLISNLATTQQKTQQKKQVQKFQKSLPKAKINSLNKAANKGIENQKTQNNQNLSLDHKQKHNKPIFKSKMDRTLHQPKFGILNIKQNKLTNPDSGYSASQTPLDFQIKKENQINQQTHDQQQNQKKKLYFKSNRKNVNFRNDVK